MFKSVTIKVDDELKRKAEQLFKKLGLNMTTAINVFLTQAVNRECIPFDIKLHDGFYNEYNQKRLLKSIRQMEEGKRNNT